MSSAQLQQAAELILSGGVIAYPTEAVFGLGCNPDDEQAVNRILKIKQRSYRQGVILIADKFERFKRYLEPVDQETELKIQSRWPGPVTWLLPASKDCPSWVRGDHEKLAVRVSSHPECQQLSALTAMPLVSTSANRHGEEPGRTADEVNNALGDEVDMVLDAATLGYDQPSEIWDAVSGERLR